MVSSIAEDDETRTGKGNLYFFYILTVNEEK